MNNYFNQKEGFERPNHPDFMDASELKAMNFSGVRHNSLSDDTEIWIDGERVKIISAVARSINPHAVEEAFQEVFKLEHCASVADLMFAPAKGRA